MAHALGHSVVAEGVETESQAMCLQGLQCDYLQGFLLSRPVAPEKIPALIAQFNPALANLSFSPNLRPVSGENKPPRLRLDHEVLSSAIRPMHDAM